MDEIFFQTLENGEDIEVLNAPKNNVKLQAVAKDDLYIEEDGSFGRYDEFLNFEEYPEIEEELTESVICDESEVTEVVSSESYECEEEESDTECTTTLSCEERIEQAYKKGFEAGKCKGYTAGKEAGLEEGFKAGIKYVICRLRGRV